MFLSAREATRSPGPSSVLFLSSLLASLILFVFLNHFLGGGNQRSLFGFRIFFFMLFVPKFICCHVPVTTVLLVVLIFKFVCLIFFGFFLFFVVVFLFLVFFFFFFSLQKVLFFRPQVHGVPIQV